MKTYTQSSRFVQPKKVGRGSEEPAMRMLDSPANQGKLGSNDSPQSITDFNIVEELCSLEHEYSKSFSKWDNIRKMDEREHAIMQGKALVPYDEDISPKELLAGKFAEKNENNVRNDLDAPFLDEHIFISTKIRDLRRLQLRHLISWYLFLLVLLRLANFLSATSYTNH